MPFFKVKCSEYEYLKDKLEIMKSKHLNMDK